MTISISIALLTLATSVSVSATKVMDAVNQATSSAQTDTTGGGELGSRRVGLVVKMPHRAQMTVRTSSRRYFDSYN